MKRGGKTISEVANEIGISNVALSNILTGKSVPKSSTVIKLASTLQVPVHTLFMKPVVLSSIRFRTAKMLSPREKAAKQQVLLDVPIWLQNYVELEELLGKQISVLLPNVAGLGESEAAQCIRSNTRMDGDDPFPIYQSWFHSWAFKLCFMIWEEACVRIVNRALDASCNSCKIMRISP
jgi:transcriptional regulator with XRE-family HTH domain